MTTLARFGLFALTLAATLASARQALTTHEDHDHSLHRALSTRRSLLQKKKKKNKFFSGNGKKKKKKSSAPAATGQTTDAMPRRSCSFDHHLKQQLQTDQDLSVNLQAIEANSARYSARLASSRIRDDQIRTIKVVVHVVYKDQTQNVPDNLLRKNIAQLNLDFMGENPELGTKTPDVFLNLEGRAGIRFEIDRIIRKQSTARAKWGDNDDVKKAKRGGSNPIEPEKFLNIWVCNIGGGTLGYAQFPGGRPATDGVVLSWQHVTDSGKPGSPFSMGRTLTHEVGHYLGLYHIWEGTCATSHRGDRIADTPPQRGSSEGCPKANQDTCKGGQPDMTMNFMDYTDDKCMWMFTKGQVEKMRSVLEPSSGARKELASFGDSPKFPTNIPRPAPSPRPANPTLRPAAPTQSNGGGSGGAGLGGAIGSSLTWSGDWVTETGALCPDGKCVGSGKIGHRQKSVMTTTIRGPAKLSWKWKASSEKWLDELFFQVDGRQKWQATPISGPNGGWETIRNIRIESGVHKISFVYEKDQMVSKGLDRGFVDSFVVE